MPSIHKIFTQTHTHTHIQRNIHRLNAILTESEHCCYETIAFYRTFVTILTIRVVSLPSPIVRIESLYCSLPSHTHTVFFSCQSTGNLNFTLLELENVQPRHSIMNTYYYMKYCQLLHWLLYSMRTIHCLYRLTYSATILVQT